MQFDAHILALRLKKLRNKRNITQEHLAEMADLSTVYISYMERGVRVPSLEKLIDVCNALECTMDELLDGFLTAKPSNSPITTEQMLADCSIEERKFLMKVCRAFQEFLQDTI